MEKDCVFCKISVGEIPAEFTYETEDFVVFDDSSPSAPIHMLIVPRKHYKDIIELPDDLWVKARKLILDISKERKFKGFRIAINYGVASHMKHMHFHLLSGISKHKKV